MFRQGWSGRRSTTTRGARRSQRAATTSLARAAARSVLLVVELDRRVRELAVSDEEKKNRSARTRNGQYQQRWQGWAGQGRAERPGRAGRNRRTCSCSDSPSVQGKCQPASHRTHNPGAFVSHVCGGRPRGARRGPRRRTHRPSLVRVRSWPLFGRPARR